MNTALVDHLACPRCGPSFGLVLLAKDVRDPGADDPRARGRVVRRGELGCPNCREAYPVEEGCADLRPPPRAPLPPPALAPVFEPAPPAQSARDDVRSPVAPGFALRLAAAVGLQRAIGGAGPVVVSEGCRAIALPLEWLVSEAEVVVIARSTLRGDGKAGRTSPLVAGAAWPLRDGAARGAVLAGPEWEPWWREAARVLAPGARLVGVAEMPMASAPQMSLLGKTASEGLALVLEDGGLLVLEKRPGSRRPKLPVLPKQ